MDTLSQSLGRLCCTVYLLHFFIHFQQMVIDKLVHNLSRQVNPYVKNSLLILFLKRVLQVFLNIWNNYISSSEVHCIPLSISLSILLSFLANTSVREQMINKFYWKDFYFFNIFEIWNINMGSLGYIQENSVDKEQESLYVEVLAPR